MITSANREIGLALALRCLAAGKRVVAACRDSESARELRALAAEPRLRLAQREVSDADSVARFAAAAARARTPTGVHHRLPRSLGLGSLRPGRADGGASVGGSADGLFGLIESLTLEHSGRFWT